LTHSELRRRGIQVGDVPLGDPGFLIPDIFRPGATAGRRYRLGLVPHVFDRDHPFFLEAAAHPDVKVLDVCATPDAFFADMAACAAIASSSLHGLIFGEAYGLPTLWLEVSDKVIGGGFKFADWFSLARNPQQAPHRPETFVSAIEIVDRCEPREVEIDKDALVQALTADVLEACSHASQPQRMMMSLADCRSRPIPVFVVSRTGDANFRSTLSSPGRGSETVVIVDCADAEDGALPADELVGVNEAVGEFFRDWQEPSRFAVTGRPEDLSRLATGALDVYDDLLDRFPRVDSVGPLYDEPAHVITGPLGHAPTSCECRLVEGSLDVGLGLYRAGKSLGPTMLSLRVCTLHHWGGVPKPLISSRPE